jgi:hypothetical protein
METRSSEELDNCPSAQKEKAGGVNSSSTRFFFVC